MKPGKVLCCLFLLAVLRAGSAKKTGKIQKLVVCACATNRWKHCKHVIHA